MARVFLSHASSDKPVVRRIAEALSAAGHVPWVDEKGIPVGASIPAGVESALGEADVVVICLSSAAERSKWVQAERDAILMEKNSERPRQIIPVRLEDVAPPLLLKSIKYVDLFPDAKAFAEGIAELTRSIAAHEAQRKAATAAVPGRIDSPGEHRRVIVEPVVRPPSKTLRWIVLGIVGASGIAGGVLAYSFFIVPTPIPEPKKTDEDRLVECIANVVAGKVKDKGVAEAVGREYINSKGVVFLPADAKGDTPLVRSLRGDPKMRDDIANCGDVHEVGLVIEQEKLVSATSGHKPVEGAMISAGGVSCITKKDGTCTLPRHRMNPSGAPPLRITHPEYDDVDLPGISWATSGNSTFELGPRPPPSPSPTVRPTTPPRDGGAPPKIGPCDRGVVGDVLHLVNQSAGKDVAVTVTINDKGVAQVSLPAGCQGCPTTLTVPGKYSGGPCSSPGKVKRQ